MFKIFKFSFGKNIFSNSLNFWSSWSLFSLTDGKL